MSNADEKRAKSLNDIAEVFRRGGHVEAEVSKISLENVVSEQFNKNQKENALLSKDEDRERSDSDDFHNAEEDADVGKRSKGPKTSRLNVDEQLNGNSKIHPHLTPLSVEKSLQEISDEKWKKQKRILTLVDIFFSLVLITPMTVNFWRGTWTIMDIHVDVLPGWFSFLLGFLVHTSFAILKNLLHARAITVSRKKTCLSMIVCKAMQILYTYVFGIACVMHWRGAWIIFDLFFLYNVWVTSGVSLAITMTLIALRSMRNIIAPPAVIVVDKLVYVFRFPTRFKLSLELSSNEEINYYESR